MYVSLRRNKKLYQTSSHVGNKTGQHTDANNVDYSNVDYSNVDYSFHNSAGHGSLYFCPCLNVSYFDTLYMVMYIIFAESF